MLKKRIKRSVCFNSQTIRQFLNWSLNVKIIKAGNFSHVTTVTSCCWHHGTMPSIHAQEKASKRKRITGRSDCGCGVHHVTHLLLPRLWRGGPCIMGLTLQCSSRHQSWSPSSESRQGWRKCAPCSALSPHRSSPPQRLQARLMSFQNSPQK